MHSQTVLGAACLLAAAACATRAAAARLTITNVSIIDMASGKVQEPQNIVMQDNKIASIYKADGGGKTKRCGETVDGTGLFAMPGLCDMHVHSYFTNDAARFSVTDNVTFPLLLANGVTCIRDLGSNLTAIKAAKTRVAAHQLRGPPRIFFSGPMLDGPDSPYETAVRLETPEQARQAVTMLKSQGVDFIKVHLKPSREVFDGIAEAVRDEGMRFGGHVPDAITAQYAVDKGFNFIEHMSRTEQRDTKLREAIVARGVWQCPTLKLAPVRDRLALTKALKDDGAPMVAGTDSPAGRDLCPGASLLDELELMGEAGLTPLEVLQAATTRAAEFLGREDIGKLVRGSVADVVLLRRNPVEDIAGVREIEAVVADGVAYRRDELDGMLKSQERLVQCDREGKREVSDIPAAGCCSMH